MNVARIAAMFALLTAGSMIPLSSIAVPVEIESYVWTDHVAKRQPARTYKVVARVRGLYLWTRVKGNAQALDYIRRNGAIPVVHKWYRLNSRGMEYEGFDDIALDVGSQEDLRKLEGQVAQTGFFTWRVWSRKENLTPGQWLVKIVTDEDDPVPCADGGTQRVKCELEIEIR